MRARIWGCRGSLPAPGPETVRYGGNTSCVELRLSDGTLIVIDAGTGIRPLGVQLDPERPKKIDILLTHLHMDHIEGIGFFNPLWREDVDIRFWGPRSPLRSLEFRLQKYLSPPLFPVMLSDIPSHPKFSDAPVNEWRIGSAKITAEFVKHPNPTVGFRIEENGHVLTYISDHEPALGEENLRTADPEWISGYQLALGADVLLHDSQYTEEEYAHRVGWGHSCVRDAVTFAGLTQVKQLVMFHHDPMHTDGMLEEMLVDARDLWKGEGKPPVLAYEGMEIDLEAGTMSAPAQRRAV